MAEKHRCQAPRLCASNCGFFGSPATLNLCSKCYRDLQLKEQQSSSAKLALNQSLVAASSLTSPSSSALSIIPVSPPAAAAVVPVTHSQRDEIEPTAEVVVTPAVQSTRCVSCRWRVGLTGFECRCGMTFCGAHRYPECHGCTFDFKGEGRKQIARANPVVKAEKLEKI